MVSMGLVPWPRRTPEESGTFRVEDVSERVPVFPFPIPDERVRRHLEATLRVEDIPQETAERLLAAGLGAIPGQTRRKP
jgi:hypothetical protein